MKYLALLLLLACGASKPKYNIGDCIRIAGYSVASDYIVTDIMGDKYIVKSVYKYSDFEISAIGIQYTFSFDEIHSESRSKKINCLEVD